MSMNSFHSRKSRPAPVVRDKARPARLGLRLDQALVDQGLAPSRSVAQRLIASGGVSWEGRVLAKPSQEVPADARLEVVPDEAERYVSRGALKLEGGLRSSGVLPQGLNCLDVGQSTGGFTDCLLQAGAARVVGVDVGHGQLHPRLQADPRVLALEGINCRALDAADLGEAMPPGGFDLIVADVSFISLTLILPRLPA
ncbi:TlyA family RNA methyltransferase, partial [Azovibrio restrictus]|uniref:TlyA family RNA methyltransferase n=1 Tax=Azovibrio restrictus TaxID=146938 RepID=UPI0026F1985C